MRLKSISLVIALPILIVSATYLFEDTITLWFYPEFGDDTRREVMTREECFNSGGEWWLHETGECGFKD